MVFKKRRIFDLRQVEQQQREKSKGNGSHEIPSGTSGGRWMWKLRFNQWLSENLRNYCQTTSLHGFNYITRRDISRYERIFWLCVVLLAIATSIALVTVSWFWNRETPTVTVIESSHYPTWNIRFPAITVCNYNRISKTKALNLQQRIKLPPNVTDQHIRQLFGTRLLPVTKAYDNKTLLIFQTILTENKLTLELLSKLIAPNCLEMISRCVWKGMSQRCDSLFQTIQTAEGTCCSFNYFGAMTNNFPEKIAYQVPKRPYRITGCGYPTGLTIHLNPMVEDYYATFFSGYGFRVFIHDAYNVPDENSETTMITSSRENFVRISPESTYATNDIRSMDVELRNCLFGNERKLKALQRYSYINCMYECRVHMLVDKCGCLPFDLRHYNTSRACGVQDLNCISSARKVFYYALPNLTHSLSAVLSSADAPCGCLPDCQTNEYQSESTVGRLNTHYKRNKYIGQYSKMNDTNNILVHVFFNDLMSTRFRREIFQNWLSALASFGGLLGLIMGFSIVTAFEFFYFLTFRPVFNYFNRD